MTVPEAARLLGCTPPTVRKLVADGHLPAVETQRGTRTFRTLRRADVKRFLSTHGGFNQRGGRPAAVSDGEIRALRDEVSALAQRVDDGAASSPDMRAEVVALREAVQLQRAAVAELLEADDARAEGMRLLLEAMRSFETADGKRRKAASILDQVIGSLTIPGNAEELT